jgi:hypothetical protein
MMGCKINSFLRAAPVVVSPVSCDTYKSKRGHKPERKMVDIVAT